MSEQIGTVEWVGQFGLTGQTPTGGQHNRCGTENRRYEGGNEAHPTHRITHDHNAPECGEQRSDLR